MADATQAYTSLKQVAWWLQDLQFEQQHGHLPGELPPPKEPSSSSTDILQSVCDHMLAGDLFHYGYSNLAELAPVVFVNDLITSSSEEVEDEGGDALFAELDPTSVDIDLMGWFPPPPPPQDDSATLCTIL